MLAGHNHRLPHIERPGGAQIIEPEIDIGAVALRRLAAAERALRHQNFRRHLMRAAQCEPLLFEQFAHARQEVIVAAPVGGEDL